MRCQNTAMCVNCVSIDALFELCEKITLYLIAFSYFNFYLNNKYPQCLFK